MRVLFLPIIALLLWPTLAVADELNVLPDRLEDGPTKQMLTRYLHAQTESAFARRKARFAEINSIDDVRKYQQETRALLLEQLGPFPERTPLNATTVGKIEGDGYVMERVIFESQPRHYVTAILFLPTSSKPPYPGVVIPCGHSGSGKAAQQQIAIGLAKAGIAALSYDPIGQGERYQMLDDEGKPRFKPTDEHTLLGATSILVGRNTATYRIWDGMRAIDYLSQRKEIDPEKIGVTGCSGGGTLTSYLMALDERVACAAPSCYLTSFPRLLETIGPQDAEQNIYAQIALGIDHADYIHLRAPKPTLILASTRDFFDIEGTWDSFREAKQLYTGLGFAERVSLVETDAKHGYPRLQREAMVRWMSRWLLDKDEDIAEPEFETHSLENVQCTPRGQVMLLDDARSVMDLNVEFAESCVAQRENLWRQGNRDNALAKVREIAGIRELDALPVAKVRPAGKLERNGYAIEKIVIVPEDGIALPALLFRPEKETGKPYLYLHGLGKNSLAKSGGPLEKLALGGNTVLTVDLRGTGETGPDQESLLGANWKDIFISYLLGRSLLTMRSEDTLVCARYLSELTGGGKINLVAVGAAGPPAMHAAALEGDLFVSAEFTDSLTSWAEYLRTPEARGQMVNVVHGALQYYDLLDLTATLPQANVAE